MMKRTLLLIPLASMVLAGCTLPDFVTKMTGKVTKTAEEKAVEQAVLKDCKFDKDACKYMVTSMTMYSKPLMMRSESQVKGYGTQISETSTDGAENMHIVSYEGTKETSNMIILGKATYTKDYKDNAWFEQIATEEEKTENPVSNVKELIDNQKEKLSEETADDTVMNKLGQEPCGSMAPGLTCFKYEMYQAKTPTDKSLIWFDTKDYLVRKMEISYSGMASTTTYVYKIDPIVKPSPVKPMPKFDAESGGPGAPSQAEIEKMMKQYSQEAPTEAPADESVGESQ